FGVMLLAAGDPNLVANDPALLFNDRGKSPLLFYSDVLNDIDALSVLLRLNHLHSPGTAMDFCSARGFSQTGVATKLGTPQLDSKADSKRSRGMKRKASGEKAAF